jgi:UDP-glucuronate decarboxylase
LQHSPDREKLAVPNLGNPDEFTINQLAQLVVEMTGCKSKLTYMPLPGDDPLRRQPDITLAKQHLEWQPKIALREGLKLTIDYFDRMLSAGRVDESSSKTA